MASKAPPTSQKANSPPVVETGARVPPIVAQAAGGSNRSLAKLFRMASSVAPVASNLRISSPDDPAEREAERVAAEVMRMPDDAIVALTNTVQPAAIHRKCVACEEEDERKIQRSAASGDVQEDTPTHTGQSKTSNDGTADSSEVTSEIERPGKPLADQTRAFFEPRFGSDFSAVRIHDDSRAAQSARNLHANAYTVGNSIVFGAGQYSPDTTSGQHLLAHELAHVIQTAGVTQGGEEILRYPMDYEPPAARPDDGVLIDHALRSEDPADVKRISRGVLASSVIDDVKRQKLIWILCNKQSKLFTLTWIGPREESALESLWQGYGERLFNLDWKVHGPLWKTSSEGGAQLSKLPAVQKRLEAFRTRASEITLTLMDVSEQSILQEKRRYGVEEKVDAPVNQGRATGFMPSTYSMQTDSTQSTGLFAASGQMVTKLKKAFDARLMLRTIENSLYGSGTSNGVGNQPQMSAISVFSGADFERARSEADAARRAYDMTRLQLEPRFPILASYAVPLEDESSIMALDVANYKSKISDLEKLSQGANDERAGVLMKEIADRLDKIKQVRGRLMSEKDRELDNLWKLPRVMAITKSDQKADAGSFLDGLVNAKVEDITADEEFVEMMTNAAALALGLIAAIPTGGASVALSLTVAAATTGAAAVSAVTAARSIDKYRLESATSSTTFGRAQALSADDPSLAWLALDIAGAIFDVVEAGKAFRAVAEVAIAVRNGRKSTAVLAAVAEAKTQEALLAAGKKPEMAAAEAASLGKRIERGAEALQGANAPSKEITAVEDAMRVAGQAIEADATSLGKTVDGVHDLKITPKGNLAICSEPCSRLSDRFYEVLSRDSKLDADAYALEARAKAAIKLHEPERSRVLDGIKRDYQDLVQQCESKLSTYEQAVRDTEELGDKASDEAKFEKLGEVKRDSSLENLLHEQIGEKSGRAQALEDQLSPSGWINPRRVGFDDIRVNPNGGLVIVEYKGNSQLSKGQMQREWVQKNINEMRAMGDTQWADRLQSALDAGTLKGRTYQTDIVNGRAVGKPRVLPEGTMTYAPKATSIPQ